MNPLDKLTLQDFQNLMKIVEGEHSMQRFGAMINRAGSTVNRMIGILIDLEFIARNIYVVKKNKTFRILRNDLTFEVLKDYIGSSIVERQRLVGEQVNDSLELQVLPHKTISLNFTGTVAKYSAGSASLITSESIIYF